MESNSENEIDASEEDKDISMNDDSADENNDKGENVSGDNVEDDMSDIKRALYKDSFDPSIYLYESDDGEDNDDKNDTDYIIGSKTRRKATRKKKPTKKPPAKKKGKVKIKKELKSEEDEEDGFNDKPSDLVFDVKPEEMMVNLEPHPCDLCDFIGGTFLYIGLAECPRSLVHLYSHIVSIL